MKMNMKIRLLNYTAFSVSVLLLLISIFQVFILSELIPWLTLLLAGFCSTLSFIAINIVDFTKKFYHLMLSLAILNFLLMISFAFSSLLLKNIFPISLWLFFTILLLSIFQYLRNRKVMFIGIFKWMTYFIIGILFIHLLFNLNQAIFWRTTTYLISIYLLLCVTFSFLPPQKHH